MTRPSTRQRNFRTTSWSVPLSYSVVALVVGMILPRIEHHLLPDLVSTMSAPAAMSICSAIASGMIALTGIVFSLAFVMVQFSATAYSPRLVLLVARDPALSHALGVFSATFLYALMMLAWVDRGSTSKVPLISGWLVLGLLLASMAMFIVLIQRIGMLQVSRMLIFTGDQGRAAIADLYPQGESAATQVPTTDPSSLPLTQCITHSGRPQVIQKIHVASLKQVAVESGGTIEVVAAVGDTILEATPILRVHGARQPLDETVLLGTIEIGNERTIEQDAKYAIRLLVDIAIKALSPAINDPTTAVQALDQIEDLLIRLGRSQLEIGAHCDEKGDVRLIIPFPSWEDFLRLSLDEIRFCGANSVQVMRRMNALIKNLIQVLPASRHVELRHWEERLHDTVERTFADADEKQDASVADRQGLGIGEEKVSPTG